MSSSDRLAVLSLEKLNHEIERDRQRRIDEHKREVAERGLTKYRLGEKGRNESLNLYADGDSWFEYPPHRDVIGWLKVDGKPKPAILNQAHHGDSAVERLGLAKRKRLLKNLNDKANGAFDGLLFSAGGNDICGDQFVLWILKYVEGTSPANSIYRDRIANMLGVLHACYADLIEIRNSYNPDCVVFLHGYDFAVPNGVGVCGLGPWLKPSLDFRGWMDPALTRLVVTEVLLAFDKMLAQLELEYRNVVYIRTQGCLRAEADWANELHPTQEGFRKIASIFLAAMGTRFPGRI